jgi:hypothetical protein
MTVLSTSQADRGAIGARTAARLALVACGLALVLLAAALVLVWASPDGPLPKGSMSRQELAIRLISRLGPPVLAGLICLRRPSNPYGWVWAGYGLGWAVVGFTDAYKLYVSAGARPLWWASPIAWVGGVAIPSLFALTALILLLFPDGRPPSRRWRGLAWTIGAVGLLGTVAAALRPAHHTPVGNPLAVEGAVGDTLRAVADFAITALLFAILVSAVSLLLRFRRSQGQQRQQLKWLAYGGGLFAALLVPALVDLQAPRLWNAVLETLTFGALYVGVGIAVLRYRLYDIDRLINRTLVYGLLTATLGLGYAGIVLLLGQLSGGIGGEPPSWAVAAATLTVAALFQPARRRIQQAVDRRFNRRRYNTAKTIEAFSTRLRDQLDLNTLSTELLAVVDQTMEPTHVSLWLRPSPPGSSDTSGSAARRTSWAY